MKRQTQAELRYATAIKALAAIRRLLPPALTPTRGGLAARPAGAGTQEGEAGPKSRTLGTEKAATVTDDHDLAKGAHAALRKLDRDYRERDG